MKIKTTGIIPARYASTRFPGKPLALLGNRPLIQWVYEACEGTFDYLAVATDDQRIYRTVEAFGGKAVLTSREHPSGTDRCLEAVEKLEAEAGFQADVVVNIQGDEPLIKKEQLMELLSCFEHPLTEIATLVQRFSKDDDPLNPDTVKVVADKEQRALFFSRAMIPYVRNRHCDAPFPYLKHIGLYGYRREVLREICKLPPSSLEQTESLEQLRWLENGYTIRIQHTRHKSLGVDTPADLERLQNYLDDPRHTG
jgi:3-deoxy-manno-octulosonate cytidylyltransferase (CMP-KDO synthetase)